MADTDKVAQQKARELEAQGWEVWLKTIFPFAFSKPFAPFHRQFWDLWWEICLAIRDKKPIEPAKLTILLLLGRALGKSSSGTPSSLMKAAIVGQIYSLYLSEVFDQAAEHLDNVRYMILHPLSRLTEFYPHLALDAKGTAKLGLKGKDSEGIFITVGGCVFRAFGLNSSGRGIGLAGKRPDDYNVDDVDNLDHSIAVSDSIVKKVTRNFLMTQDLIGDIPVTTKVLQNLIIEHGFVNQVYTNRTDALNERTVIGVVNTFERLDIETDIDDKGKTRHTILPTSIPTWEAVTIEVAQKILNLLGLEGFMAECQNDFSASRSGRVIPEYNEDIQVISWSQFAQVYGEKQIPRHWKVKAGLDIGYSEGQYPHYSAWVFVATSAMNSKLPNTVFIYRGRGFKGTSIDDQAEIIKEEIGWEKNMVNMWQMSHERTGEMMTLRQKYKLPFVKFQFYKAEDGVAQWRHLSKPNKTLPNPFKPDEMQANGEYKLGRTLLYYVVDDDQLFQPKDDKGLKLMRDQISTWEYVPVKLTESGQTAQKPSKVNDDFCFIAGTLITTANGDKAIENIKIGEMVLTRNGLRPVVNAGLTNNDAEVFELKMSNGQSLVGTPNHPIFVKDKGFIPLRCLEMNDKLVDVWQTIKQNQNQKELFTKELPSIATPKQSKGHTESIFHRIFQTVKRELVICTLNFGRMFSVKSQKVMKFTTKTETLLTMIYPTLKQLESPSICHITERPIHQKQSGRFLTTLLKPKKKQKSGIEAKKEEIFIAKSANSVGRIKKLRLFTAKTAKNLLQQKKMTHFFVQPNADHILESEAENKYLGIAEVAIKNFWLFALIRSFVVQNVSTQKRVKTVISDIQTNHQQANTVLTIVEIKQGLSNQPVYNLTVEDAHEYFANGVLVHNCDVIKSILAMFGPKATPLTRHETTVAALPEEVKPLAKKRAEKKPLSMGEQLALDDEMRVTVAKVQKQFNPEFKTIEDGIEEYVESLDW